MTDPQQPAAMARIEHAMARIEAAARAHVEAAETMKRRHGALKARMTEAVAALDDVLARGA